ncbi:hypothetical protein SCHPADRAFT_938694 [Schizopora paradoxa]|uniref:DUF6534 domain-containing protein n=1 Tax=Schizopora paradoxa TaxID=27342 RepID=A0A0H2RV57_9AGAM|nr:hypothetical protein SCHPADRAFT_938694 [Schizopora paradoxa]
MFILRRNMLANGSLLSLLPIGFESYEGVGARNIDSRHPTYGIGVAFHVHFDSYRLRQYIEAADDTLVFAEFVYCQCKDPSHECCLTIKTKRQSDSSRATQLFASSLHEEPFTPTEYPGSHLPGNDYHINIRLEILIYQETDRPIFYCLGFTLASTINILIIAHEQIIQVQELPKEWLLDSTFASSVIADLSIAAILCFHFYRSRSEIFEGTNRIMSLLSKYTINTGIIATVWAGCCLISNLLLPESYLELTFYLSQSKVYVNAFLGSYVF